MSVFIRTLRYLAVTPDDLHCAGHRSRDNPHGRVGMSGAVRVIAVCRGGATGLIGRGDRLFCYYTRT